MVWVVSKVKLLVAHRGLPGGLATLHRVRARWRRARGRRRGRNRRCSGARLVGGRAGSRSLAVPWCLWVTLLG